MKFSKEQWKIFDRIHKKHPVSLQFLQLNFNKIIKELKYITSLRFIIKRKIIRKKNRIFIRYNVSNKQIFSKIKIRKCKNRRTTTTWSKQIVMYNKKIHLLNKFKEQINEIISNSDSQNDTELNLTPDEIQKQLKTQLELLKGGKRCQPILSNNLLLSSSSAGTITPKLFTSSNSDTTKRLSLDRKSSFGGGGGGGSSCSSFDISLKDAKEAGPSNLKRIHDNLSDSSSSIDEQSNDFLNSSNNSSLNRNLLNNSKCSEEPIRKQQKLNFIDLLINKINSTEGKNLDKKNPNDIEIIQMNNDKKIKSSDKCKYNIEQHEEDSLSSGEFLGFPDVEIILPDVPGMLPTPVVPRKLSSTQSAFISEDLDKFMRDNLLDKKTNDKFENIPKSKRFEDGLVFKGAIPPKLTMASLPTELAKPRTVAEKRILLQKNKNIKYLMIENENTIYHELKKRSRDCNANIQLINSLQKQSIPATRDFWKATSWLLTENGNFYFQIANIDGVECKLIGGYGNNKNKNLPYQFSKPIKQDLKKKLECSKNCKDYIAFKNIKIRYNMNKENHKIHLVPNVKETNNNSNNNNSNYKPGPLSSKCLHLSYMPNYGSPEIYRMPKIQLEVFPKINRPLDDVCKSYLKMILPSTNITKEWAEFAVSTLLIPPTKLTSDEISTIKSNYNKTSYTFNIPYLNDQKNILVRRVYNRKEKFDKITTDDLQFRKIVNKSNDPITLECANILSEMIDSVAIGLSEDSLIKNDPDIDYLNKTEENSKLKAADNIINKPTLNIDTDKKNDKKSNRKTGNSKSRLMSELKRLNATIIDAGGPGYEEEIKGHCTKPYCRLGCVCMSLNGQKSLKKHCKKPDCMIECNCIAGMIESEDSSSCITSQDALMLRKKATARLARMEREFCSTVVLTNTETLLINESQYERKRRCTKRYLNYTCDSENDQSLTNNNVNENSFQQPPPNKRQRTAQKIKAPVTETKLPLIENYVFVNEDTMKQLKHCQVNLCKLEYFENIEKWCMIHCLYKCFCKANDLTGKPFILKKDEINVKEDIIYSRKPKYSFDKNEESSKIIIPQLKNDKISSTAVSNNGGKIIQNQKLNNSKSKIQTSSSLVINDYIKKQEELLKEKLLFRKYFEFNQENCRRLLPIPSIYKSRNRRYAITKTRSSSYIYFRETSQSELLLSERIRNSDQYKPRRNILNKTKSINSNNSDINEKESQFLKISSVVSLNPSPTRTISSQNVQQPPIISLQQDLNTDLLQTPPSDFTKIVNESPIDSKDIHKNVLKLLNYLVTKTMHNICKIQVDESKNIPHPVAESLHISQWRYFLQAYIEGLIHIWEVKVDNHVYFTGTMQNIMPFIRNAISVVNIKAIRKEQLPLLGKMLNAKVINQQTSSVSVLMAGHNDYWRILGMTKSSIDYLTQGGVIKPTPQSHPWLSTKINTLYEIMAKNRIDKILSKQQKSTNNNKNNNDNNNKNNNNDNNNQNDNTETGTTKNFIINNDEEIDRLLKMNIKIRQLTEREIIQDKFTIPLGSCSTILDYRWLVLDIVDDFSHILFVEQMECLTHNKIKIAFQRSYEEKKMVRLAKVDGKSIDCYVMKNDKDRIYLGPFQLNSNPQIVLYQNIDGKMMLREDFEKLHNINRNNSTTGFWLCRKNGKIIFDITTKDSNSVSCSAQQSNLVNINQQNTNQQNNLLPSDETIIIDQDIDSDANSKEIPSIVNNLTTNLQKLNNNSNNIKTTQNINTTNSQKLHSNIIHDKIPNLTVRKFNTSSSIIKNMKIINNSTINLNSNSILKNNKFQKIHLNTSENNSNQLPAVEQGLIPLNPGFYEINCTEKPNEINKKHAKTNNSTIIASNNSSPEKSSILYNKPVIPIQLVKSSVFNHQEDKNQFNKLLTKTTEGGKAVIGENFNNIMVAKKSTTSAALNPNTVLSKNTKVSPRRILPKPSNLSNIKSINDSIKLPSTGLAISHSKEIYGCDPLNQLKSFNISTTGIMTSDSPKLPILTNVYTLPQVPSFIRIAPTNNIIPPTTLSVPNISLPKNTSLRTNTITTQSLSNPQMSTDKTSDVNLNKSNTGSNYQHHIANSAKNVMKIVSDSSISDKNGKSLSSNTTADIKRPRTITGYFISNVEEYPKFGGMKRDPNYLIKSSSNSALQLKDINEVSKFLNSHIRKHSPRFKANYTNTKWSFLPYKKPKNSSRNKAFQITTLNNSVNTQNVGNRQRESINPKIDSNKTDVNDVIVIDDED